jgi:hypothetical protein
LELLLRHRLRFVHLRLRFGFDAMGLWEGVDAILKNCGLHSENSGRLLLAPASQWARYFLKRKLTTKMANTNAAAIAVVP